VIAVGRALMAPRSFATRRFASAQRASRIGRCASRGLYGLTLVAVQRSDADAAERLYSALEAQRGTPFVADTNLDFSAGPA
jgi:hypothetical protein